METKVEYRIVPEQLSSPDLGCYRSFGIAAFRVRGEQREQVAFASDVSTDEAFTEQLAQRCTAAQLDPVHLKDVTLDSIGR